MIRYSEIPTGVVGFRQSPLTDYAIVDSDNMATSSGLYFQDFSKFVTIQNLKDTQQAIGISNTDFNTWLANSANAAFIKVVRAVFRDESFIENDLLYKNESRVNELLENGSDFVGYEIRVAQQKDIAVALNKIITQFSGTGNVKLLLFNSTKQAAVQSKTINHTPTLSELNTEVNWDLPFANGVNGGTWYVGYLTNGLTPKAVNRTYEAADLPTLFKCFSINPIIVSGHNSETLFDIDEVEYTSDTYGLNFDMSSFYDQTSWIVQNKNNFAEAIAYQFAVDTIEQMIASVRTNEIQRITESALLTEIGGLEGDGIPTVPGLVKKLNDSVEVLRKQYFIDEPLIQKGELK